MHYLVKKKLILYQVQCWVGVCMCLPAGASGVVLFTHCSII